MATLLATRLGQLAVGCIAGSGVRRENQPSFDLARHHAPEPEPGELHGDENISLQSARTRLSEDGDLNLFASDDDVLALRLRQRPRLRERQLMAEMVDFPPYRRERLLVEPGPNAHDGQRISIVI